MFGPLFLLLKEEIRHQVPRRRLRLAREVCRESVDGRTLSLIGAGDGSKEVLPALFEP